MTVRLFFVDDHPDVVEALRAAFARFPEVVIDQGDILAVARNALVSPANCQGYMDGGIDRAYVVHFGLGLETAVREAIARRPEGLLPIGASLAVPTGDARIAYLIVAPTMIGPELVSSDHAYRGLRAVLRLAASHPELGAAVYCPGLCTGVGDVSPESAATAMAAAYRDWKTAGLSPVSPA